MKRLLLVLLVLCLLATAPMVTVEAPILGGADVVMAADEPDAGESELTYWDWCVMWWTAHLDDWPI